MRKIIIATVGAIALTGCTGTKGETYYGMQESPMWFSTAAPETIATFYRKRCASYGINPDTPEMSECIQREIRQTKMERAIRDASRPRYIYTPPARPVNTTCVRTGPYVNCSSY